MANNGDVPFVAAEWALWGERAANTGYQVLACSNGALTREDFAYLVDRYRPGWPNLLPQYTVAWVPGPSGGTEHIAVAIHELADADPLRSGGRSRTVGGREIKYIRLFCFRYADLAEYGVSYCELADAMAHQELPASGAGLVTGRLRGDPLPPPSARVRELAENVAALLLTTRPVAILNADEVSADERLAFIDLVVSLLPFGLRAHLSAATWASATAQVLNFRLFFAGAARDDGRTIHVRWGQPDMDAVRDSGHEDAWQYLSWLHRAGPTATYVLADQTAPLRFSEAEIGQLLAAMPLAPSVDETLDELSGGLRRDDKETVKESIGRLKHYLAGQPDPADREAYRHFILRHDLLQDRPSLSTAVKVSLYRVMLGLAYDTPLSYDSFCEIEDAVGGPPTGALHRVMTQLRLGSFMPAVLLYPAGPGEADRELMAAARRQGVPAAHPLDDFAQEVGRVRPAHRAAIYHFAVGYLREHAENPAAELHRRGYLAGLLAVVFPGDVFAQQSRLEEILALVYGGPLRRKQIRDLFDHLSEPPSAALEAAVTRLAAWPKAEPYVRDQARLARLRLAGQGNELV